VLINAYDSKGNSNPEIPGFGLAQSRDFGIEKRPGIPGPGFWIPGLQSVTSMSTSI